MKFSRAQSRIKGRGLQDIGLYKSPDATVYLREHYRVLSPWKRHDICHNSDNIYTRSPVIQYTIKSAYFIHHFPYWQIKDSSTLTEMNHVKLSWTQQGTAEADPLFLHNSCQMVAVKLWVYLCTISVKSELIQLVCQQPKKSSLRFSIC